MTNGTGKGKGNGPDKDITNPMTKTLKTKPKGKVRKMEHESDNKDEGIIAEASITKPMTKKPKGITKRKKTMNPDRTKEQKGNAIEALLATIAKLFEEVQRADEHLVSKMYVAGQSLLRLKQDVNARNKRSWEKYMAEKFPNVAEHVYQRSMRIARFVEEENQEQFCALGENRLLHLISIAKSKGTSLTLVLQEKGIAVPTEMDEESLTSFRTDVKDGFPYNEKKVTKPITEDDTEDDGSTSELGSGNDEPDDDDDDETDDVDEGLPIIKVSQEVNALFRPFRKFCKALDTFCVGVIENQSLLDNPNLEAFKKMRLKQIEEREAKLSEAKKLFL